MKESNSYNIDSRGKAINYVFLGGEFCVFMRAKM